VALKILLADDSTTAQNMGKKILTEAGYEVVAVSNGAAAVKKIAEHKPDMIVLDVYMPGYTGLEVCERVKSAIETNKIPVLLTVGKMEHFLPEEGARVKADGVIVKPFEASDLLAAVQKLEQRLNSSASRTTSAKVMVTPAQPPVVEEPPEYERTMKIKTPVFDEKDQSYQAWKSETEEPAPAPPPPAAPLPRLNLGLPEEDLPAAAEEPHVLNVPTDLRAAPALGLEHLDSETPHEGGPTTSDLMESPAYLEGEGSGETNPYQITEGAEDAGNKSGVGRFFSKAKSWFGGASAVEGYEDPAAVRAADEGEAETITLSPGQVQEARVGSQHAGSASMAHAASTSAAEPHMAFPEPTEAPAAPAPEADYGHSEMEAHGAVTDHGVSSSSSASSSSWEPAPHAAGLSGDSAEAPQDLSGPVLEPELQPAEHVSAQSDSGSSPDLEITSLRSTHDVPAGASSDSMLVTDVSEMSTAFPTRFGVQDAEPIPVGNASDYPELYGDAAAGTVQETEPAGTSDTQEIEAPELIDAAEAAESTESGPAEHTADFDTGAAAEVAAAMGGQWSPGNAEPEAVSHEAAAAPSHSPEASLSGWSAEETHLEENEIGVSLHEEMHQHLSEPHPGPESAAPEAVAESTASENRHDDQLAAAMAAAMGSEVTPALAEAVHQAFTGEATMALDKNTAVIAEIVHRVTERMKPELVAEIAKELASEIKKEKKKG
jgi:CheY-like chemotaxis protein